MDQFSSHPLYRKHNIDSAMSSLWEFYKNRFLSLFIMSLVMSFVIQYASTFVNMKELTSITDPMLLLEKIKGLLLPILIISLINLLFSTILQYYIIFSPVSTGNSIFISILKSLKYLYSLSYNYGTSRIRRILSHYSWSICIDHRSILCNVIRYDTLSFHIANNDG